MKRPLIWLIRFYQKYISSRTPPSCKYYLTCSNYGIEAVSEYGALVGFFMTLWRFLRCNPFSKGGFDPVPKKKKKPKRISYERNDYSSEKGEGNDR